MTYATDIVHEPTKEKLRSFIERIENLEEQKAAIASDIKDVLDEADGEGFDKKTIREVIKLRKIDPEDRRQAEGVLATYMHALGMDLEQDLAALGKKFRDLGGTVEVRTKA